MMRNLRSRIVLGLTIGLLLAGVPARAQDPAVTSEPVFEHTAPPSVPLYPLPPEPPVIESPAPPAEAPPPQPQPPGDADPLVAAVQRLYDSQGAPGAAPTETPPSRRSDSPFGAFLKGLFGLVITLALILLVYYFLQKRGGMKPLFARSGLGEVLGRVHLSPRHCLYYVRTGDRVLVVGAAQDTLSLVAEFDAAAFGMPETPPEPAPDRRDQTLFRRQLKASLQQMTRAESEEMPDDEEIASLRGEIHRLQEYLKDSTGDSNE